MNIEDHIKLQQARIATLNNKMATALALGDVKQLTNLEVELIEAEQTLARLLAA